MLAGLLSSLAYWGLVPDELALCFFFFFGGKLYSPSWKPCCRAGECLNHAQECGAGVSIFLLVRKTTILFQRSAHLALWIDVVNLVTSRISELPGQSHQLYCCRIMKSKSRKICSPGISGCIS
ncbi:unnamed protein product [Urochloa humidicola]